MERSCKEQGQMVRFVFNGMVVNQKEKKKAKTKKKKKNVL